MVNKTLYQVKSAIERERVLQQQPTVVNPPGNEADTEPTEEVVHPYISLPYKGVPGESALKELKGMIRRCLPKHVIPRFTYQGTKLGTFFRVKDKVKWGQQTDLIYSFLDEEIHHEDKPT